MINTRKSVAVLLIGVLSNPVPAMAGLLSFSEVPLFLTGTAKPNIMIMVDNSNSMDEDATGQAVGSANAASKSEIARQVVRDLVIDYGNKINMGLMAYQQSNVTGSHVHHSPYDVSYDPANYDPTFTGPRTSTTKRFRLPMPGFPGRYIYYNVGLPFYAGSPQGNGYCYSPTSTAFNNGESLACARNASWPFNAGCGPWDNYRCFTTKSTNSDALPIFGDGTSEAAAGYSGLFFQGIFGPTDSDVAQGITDFGRFNTWHWVGPTWFANTSPGKGYVHTPVAFLDATQAAKMNTKLGVSQFGSNQPVNPAFPLQNAGLTPLEGTIQTANSYFNGTLGSAAEGGSLPAPPNSCGKNFLVMLTDGLPSTLPDGSPGTDVNVMLNQTGTAASTMRASTANVLTYVVGFALPYGTNPAQLDVIAASGGTGTAYSASDPATLKASFLSIFTDIQRRSASAAAAAVNTVTYNAGSKVFQAKFSSIDWSGQFLAIKVNSDGSLDTGAASNWDAGIRLNALNYNTGRNILTWKPSALTGVAFRWPSNPASPTATEIDAAQVTRLNTSPTSGTGDGLGSARVDWIRGRNDNAFLTTNNLRRRDNTVLGDIVNSNPWYVFGIPSGGYSEITHPGYRSFRSANAGRPAVVYVGANDGMLHAFNATTGDEIFGYVPSSIYKRLNWLPARTYPHYYYVDASPMVGDADTSGSGTGWKSVLVGGLGVGGQGYFALDVTNATGVTEASAASKVLWEFTDADDVDLGNTFLQPTVDSSNLQPKQIVRLNDGHWYAILGNGYNSAAADGNAGTGRAALFLIRLSGPGVSGWQLGVNYHKIYAGTATDNGLSTPVGVDTNGDGKIDYIYAGDIKGNLWKFNLTSTSPASWSLALSGTALFSAPSGQPITATPSVIAHPDGGWMVNVGTGLYLQNSDITDATPQSIYGIWDLGTAVGSRANLQQRTLTGAGNFRTGQTTPFDDTKKGWYIDLPDARERVVSPGVYRPGYRYVASSLVTDTSNPCQAGGYGWLNEIDAITGAQSDTQVFDTNADGRIDSADTIVASVKSRVGIINTPAVINLPKPPATLGGGAPNPNAIPTGCGAANSSRERSAKLNPGSSGTVQSEVEAESRRCGRMSWREVRQ